MNAMHASGGAGRSAGTAHDLKPAVIDSFVKLAPRHAIRNPIIAVVWAGTVVTAVATLSGRAGAGFGWAVTLVLFITVLFANFAEAVAEAHGRGQAASLRRARKDLIARRLDEAGK